MPPLRIACLLLASLIGPTRAQSPTPDAASRAPTVQPLAPGVWLLPGRFERGRQPDGNSLLIEGPQGLVLIDSGRHAEHTEALMVWARQHGQVIRAVINTHWHLDHLGGNARLRDALPGLRAYAAPAVREATRERMPRSEQELHQVLADPATDTDTRRMVEIDLGLYARRALLEPDELIEGPPHRLDLAGRELDVGVERGVSGGDVWVLDRASGTLALGDFITLPVPFFDTACAPQWQAAFTRLAALPFERVVPGHGPVMSRADFDRYRSAFDHLLVCAASSSEPGVCSAAWISDLGPLLPDSAQRGSHGMLRYYIEQRLRGAQSRLSCP
jgi:glyoxylase-like metal-dependent hydrolase (beta-lactamase superfamily II)